MGWAWREHAEGLEEDRACGVALAASAVGLVVLAGVGFFLPRPLVLPFVAVGSLGVMVFIAREVVPRSAAPPLVLAGFCAAPAVVLGLLMVSGVAGMGLGTLVVFVAGGAGVWAVLRRQRPAALEDGAVGRAVCPACAYDLGGLESLGVCPECGFGEVQRCDGADAGAVRLRVWRIAGPSHRGVGADRGAGSGL